MSLNRRQFAALAAIAACAFAGAALAQSWPDKTIRFVVPYTPGGGTDAVTRQLADAITRDTKWAFLVDNKPGAAGNIGMDQVAKAAPDGYTLGMGQTANMAINPAALSHMPFDASKDFVPVALVAAVPTVLVVRADSPWKSLADLVKAGKAKDGGLNQALAGTGTVGHLSGVMLASKAGFKTVDVPYKGAAPAVTDLLAGQTDFMFATPQAIMGMLQGNKLRALAVTSAKRVNALPNVPTVAEQGYPGFVAVDWKVVIAPAGTPADVVTRLNAAVAKAMTQPAVVARLADEASTAMHGNPQEAAKFVHAEQAKWATLIKQANIHLD
ncbi:tripartite tricarboxylate transporter substrate binding protein [Ramlibacter agri]|uniref:Bug family tripartite tricarboxylate transporter substrate binding protein n=1 Tax=Ramlibacter agri TaxID=2728837 RepID=UPI00315A6524